MFAGSMGLFVVSCLLLLCCFVVWITTFFRSKTFLVPGLFGLVFLCCSLSYLSSSVLFAFVLLCFVYLCLFLVVFFILAYLFYVLLFFCFVFLFFCWLFGPLVFVRLSYGRSWGLFVHWPRWSLYSFAFFS